MNDATRKYLGALLDYARSVRVPGLDIESESLLLGEVFIDLNVELQEADMPAQHDETAPRQPVPPAIERASVVLAREEQMVLLGEPGQGKTTLLRQYAWNLAQDSDRERLPLLIELGRQRDKTHSDRDFAWLHERLPDVLSDALGIQGWNSVCAALRSAKASVLLDGFDELSADAQQEVRERVGGLKGNQVVLASRPHVYRQYPFDGFLVCQLRELEPAQVEAFARNVSQALGKQYRVLNWQLPLQVVLQVSRSQAAAMARNPLLLSFMCLTAINTYSQKGVPELPKRAVALIHECVEALVAWHRDRKPRSTWPRTLTSAGVSRVLGPLAVDTFKSASGLIKSSSLEDFNEKDKTIFFEHLLPARFVEQRHADYAFPLETFREYFAAQAIAAMPDPFAEVRDYLHSPPWQQVILYTVGSLENIDASRIDLAMPTLSRLFVKSVGPLIRVIASLAGFAAGTQSEPIAEGVKDLAPHVSGPLDKWLANSRRSTEYFVAAILNHHSLCENILRRDWRLAFRCLGTARACPERTARQLAPARPWGNTEEKISLANALSDGAEHPIVWKVLLELARDNSSYVRAAAAQALRGAISEAEVRDCLLGLMRDDHYPFSNSDVAGAAAKALRAVASEVPVREQLLELSRDVNSDVRHVAVLALEWAVHEPLVSERFLELIRDKDVFVQYDAAHALGVVASEAQMREHLLQLSRDVDEDVRKWAVRALEGAVSEPQVRDRLLEMTRDDHRMARYFAVTALLKAVSQPAVRERFLELNEDSDVNVRSTVQWALQRPMPRAVAREPDPRTDEQLLEAMRGKRGVERSSAAMRLKSKASNPLVWERLLEYTQSDDNDLRYYAALALQGAVAGAKVRDRLLELMEEDDDRTVRGGARLAIGVLPGSAVTRDEVERVAHLAQRDQAFVGLLERFVQEWEKSPHKR